MKTAFLVLLFPLSVSAQDLTGVWTGFIITGENKLPYEIAISKKNNELTGFAMTVFTFNGVKNVGLKTISIKEKKGKILVEDDKLIYDNYTTTARRVILRATLEPGRGKSMNMLSGSFSTRTIDIRARGYPSYSGTVELTKKINDQPSEILGVLHELDLLGDLSFLPINNKEQVKPVISDPTKQKVESAEIKSNIVTIAPAKIKDLPEIKLPERKNEIIREINLRSDSLILTLYDNGEVDGDTVTVLLNGKVLMNKKGLTAQPIRQTIYLTSDLGDSVLLVMYAENLGFYPPNTGLLTIQDGAQSYRMTFNADFQRNSAIVLRRKK